MTEQQPVPAATVVLARQGDADIEVLLLLRSTHLVFNGGSWVFPGGRIDPEDYPEDSKGLEYHAACQAAVRETWEEAGVKILPGELIHTAHWTTPPNLPRRFSTWFFVCPMTVPVEVKVDRSEILEHRWITPEQALREYAEQKLRLPHPTRETLTDLSRFRALDQLIIGLAQCEVRVFPASSPYYRPEEMGFFRAAPVI
ncbi:MAG: NUDIX hydrolase [Pseudohongiellaceae bacterium]